MRTARQRAQALVTAWIEADYEPDPVDGEYMSADSLEALIERVADVYQGQLLITPDGKDVVKMGTPARVVKGHDEDRSLRNPECPAYTQCLNHAVRKGWPAFSCHACSGPGSDRAPRDGHYEG
ncbi:MAG: hypothetical protein ACOC9W_05935 [Persicimonas sp.]